MASKYESGNVDLDSIFEPRTTAKIANVGREVNGVDISNRYEKLASGSAASATGYRSGGADLNTYFAALGSVSTTPSVVMPSDFTIFDSALTGGSPTTVRAELQVQIDGDLFAVRAFGSNSDVGDWVDSKTGLVGGDFEVRATLVSGSLDGGTVNTWLSLSSTRQWWVTHTSSGSVVSSATIDVEVREVGNISNADTVRVNLNAGTET